MNVFLSLFLFLLSLYCFYCVFHCRLEKDSRCFSYIFEYLDDKGLQKELWGKSIIILYNSLCTIYLWNICITFIFNSKN